MTSISHNYLEFLTFVQLPVESVSIQTRDTTSVSLSLAQKGSAKQFKEEFVIPLLNCLSPSLYHKEIV